MCDPLPVDAWNRRCNCDMVVPHQEADWFCTQCGAAWGNEEEVQPTSTCKGCGETGGDLEWCVACQAFWHVAPSGGCPGRHEALRGRGGLCPEHGAQMAAMWWERRESPLGTGEAEAAAEEAQQAGANQPYPGIPPEETSEEPPPPGGGGRSTPRTRMVRLRNRPFFSRRTGGQQGMANLPQTSSSAPPAVRGRKRKRRDAPETKEDDVAGKDEEESDSSFPGAAAAAGGGEQNEDLPGILSKWPAPATPTSAEALGRRLDGSLLPGISVKAPPGALPKSRGAPGGAPPPPQAAGESATETRRSHGSGGNSNTSSSSSSSRASGAEEEEAAEAAREEPTGKRPRAPRGGSRRY